MKKSLYITDHQALLNKLYRDFISTKLIFRNLEAKYLKSYGCNMYHAEFRVKRSLVSKVICCGNKDTEGRHKSSSLYARLQIAIL
jgi:hypothetical protein